MKCVDNKREDGIYGLNITKIRVYKIITLMGHYW